MRRIATVVSGLALLLSGCGGSKKVDVVDLNKVLDIFVRVMNEKDSTANTAQADGKPKVTNTSAKPKAAGGAKSSDSIQAVKEDKDKQQKILKRFADELNKAKLISKPIGVQFMANGSIEGFTDKNKNMKMERAQGDKRIFKIQLDQKGKRLIASDEHGYHRDHRYRYRPSGFFMGYMFGRMFSGHRSYYTGSRRPPNYSQMRMSPKTYHRSAVSKVRSRTSGFRSRSGSGGFSFGK